MPFALSRSGDLTSTFVFVYEHDAGTVEERITYRPAEVERNVQVEFRTGDEGEEMRLVEDQGPASDGWQRRTEWVYEWMDRVVVGKLPFLDAEGNLLSATELWNHNDPRIQPYRFLIREIETQIRQHHNPLARSLMELRRQS